MIKMNKLGAEIILLSCLLSGTIDLNVNAQELNENVSYEEISYDSIYNIYFHQATSYYRLDYDLVLLLAKNVTNNFQTNAGLSTPVCDEFAFSLEFVHKLYTNPSYFDVDLSDFVSCNETYLEHNDFDHFFYNICNEFGVDYKFSRAVSDYETGYQTSNQAINKFNYGGLRGNGGYLSFPSKEAGIISYVIYFKNLNGSKGIENVEHLSGKYVNGDYNKPDKKWCYHVLGIYNNVAVPNPVVLFTLS